MCMCMYIYIYIHIYIYIYIIPVHIHTRTRVGHPRGQALLRDVLRRALELHVPRLCEEVHVEGLHPAKIITT